MKKTKKAFTLIELLVVVLIIGILSAVALPQYQVAVEKSRAAEALINIRAIRNAIEVAALANDGYENVSLKDLDISVGTYEDGLFKTKYFNYEYDGEEIDVYSVNSEYTLYYNFYAPDKYFCYFLWSDKVASKVCFSLCGTSVSKEGNYGLCSF